MGTKVELAKPGLADIFIPRGSALSAQLAITQSGTAYDLTGLTFVSQVRRSSSKRSELLATIDCSISGSPTAGLLSISSETIANIEEGDYRYDIYCVEQKRTFVKGALTITGTVTRI